VIVGSNTFYLDPTHDHPIPSVLLEFFVSIRGFTDAVILPLKRSPEVFDATDPGAGEWANGVTRFAQYLSEELIGAEDYAVIARRAL
jgi:O-antigen chain-terminating methyltransferase